MQAHVLTKTQLVKHCYPTNGPSRSKPVVIHKDDEMMRINLSSNGIYLVHTMLSDVAKYCVFIISRRSLLCNSFADLSIYRIYHLKHFYTCSFIDVIIINTPIVIGSMKCRFFVRTQFHPSSCILKIY